jgi:hypothetical protein
LVVVLVLNRLLQHVAKGLCVSSSLLVALLALRFQVGFVSHQLTRQELARL